MKLNRRYFGLAAGCFSVGALLSACATTQNDKQPMRFVDIKTVKTEDIKFIIASLMFSQPPTNKEKSMAVSGLLKNGIEDINRLGRLGRSKKEIEAFLSDRYDKELAPNVDAWLNVWFTDRGQQTNTIEANIPKFWKHNRIEYDTQIIFFEGNNVRSERLNDMVKVKLFDIHVDNDATIPCAFEYQREKLESLVEKSKKLVVKYTYKVKLKPFLSYKDWNPKDPVLSFKVIESETNLLDISQVFPI